MARNKKNLKMQMLEKLDSLNRIGMKKEKEGNGCARANGVHSVSSMKTYRSAICSFGDWMKEMHKDVRTMDGVNTDMIKEYVEARAKECSNFTISKDISALNKIFHEEDRQFWNLSDFGDYRRKSKDIVHNRLILTDNHTNDLPRNASGILFCRAFGIRRQSVEKITTDNLIYNANDEIVALSVIEKGGKSRVCYCLPEYREEINQYVSERITQLGDKCGLCDPVDSNCNLHVYRAYYAETAYRGLCEARAENRDYFEGMYLQIVHEGRLYHALERYKNGEGGYRAVKGYSSYEIAIVSQMIGHNRLDVIFSNYVGHGMEKI